MRKPIYLVLAVVFSFNVLVKDAAAAGNLSTVISDLYGGNGILLSPQSAIHHQAHFVAASITALDNLNTAVTGALGFSSFNSTTTGVTFDLSQGIPVATKESMGPLLSERATSLGQGKLNLGFSYSHVDFDSFQGTDLNHLALDFHHVDCCTGDPVITSVGPDGKLTGFEKDVVRVHINLKLNEDIFGFYANYGLTKNLDVGMIIPVVSVEAKANAHAEVIEDIPGSNIHTFAGDPSAAIDSTGGSKTGIGDVVLRAKYTFVSMADLPSMAVLGQITTPTGDEKNLLGSGEAKFKGMFIASKRFGRLTPHVNVAYEATTGPSVQNNWTYALGADARMTQTFTVAADVLGRYNPSQHEIGNHLVDLALAAKWNPFKQHNAPFNVYVIVPLNKNQGLRSDVIWGLGIDYAYR